MNEPDKKCSCGAPILDAHCQNCGTWHESWDFGSDWPERGKVKLTASLPFTTILTKTYAWLLSKYGTRSKISIDLRLGEQVIIHVGEFDTKIAYYQGSVDQFLVWVENNVDLN